MKGMVLKLGVTAVMLLSFLSSLAYDFEVDGIYYDVVSITDFTCEVVKGDVDYTGDVVIPSEIVYNGRTLTVTKIGEYAFLYCSELTSVTIPDSVTTIEHSAFWRCTLLTSVTIPDSVTKIGGFAFEGCTSLTSVSIPDSVTWIGGGAFEDCTSLTSVTIPDSVTRIPEYAFSGCTSLTSVSIPDSVTQIGWLAFNDCSTLKTIKFGNNLELIYFGAFANCKSLSSISIPGSVKEISIFYYAGAYYDPPKKDFIFEGCDNLKKIVFEYGKKSLELGYSNQYEYGNIVGHETSFDYLFVNSYKYENREEIVNFLPITSLDFDRKINGAPLNAKAISCLENLTCGKNLLHVDITDIQNLKSLKTITCLSATPPQCNDFSNSQYLNVTVKVPFEYLEAYQRVEPWKNFWNLQGFDPSGIDDVDFDSTPTETGRYDLNGRPISDSYEGIAIIRYSDGSTKKAVVRK